MGFRGFRVYGFRGLGFRVEGLGFRVQGLWFRGLGFQKSMGWGFRALGFLGFRI